MCICVHVHVFVYDKEFPYLYFSQLDEEKQTAKSELPSDEAFLRDYKARRMGELKEQASKGPAGQRCTCTHTYTRTYTHTRTHARTPAHTHTQAHTTHTQAHTHEHTHTHTSTHTSTHTHMHRHKHTHVSPFLGLSCQWPCLCHVHRRYFGNLLEIRGDKFADVIDNAPSDVFVIIHIYDEVSVHMLCLRICT